MTDMKVNVGVSFCSFQLAVYGSFRPFMNTYGHVFYLEVRSFLLVINLHYIIFL